jgi:hypothetical protein
MERREFIKTITQKLILSGILLLTGYLLLKKKSGSPCEFDFVCKKCKNLNSCTLPEAQHVKPLKF